jgi:hypothetical protein
MGAAAAAVAVAERRIVQAFEIAGATSPESARLPDDILVGRHGIGWRRLTRSAVIRESAPGSGFYYLDRGVWQAVRRRRIRLLSVLFILIIAIWLYIATMGLLHSGVRSPSPSGDPAAPGIR